MSTTTNPSDESTCGTSPEEVYAFFKNMPPEGLSELANQAVSDLNAATNRAEAEEAVVKMAPFFLDCTFGRLRQEEQQAIRDCMDQAEKKHGSLADVLGVDKDLSESEADEDSPRVQTSYERGVLSQLIECCPGKNVPRDRPEAAKLARVICAVDASDYNKFTDLSRVVLQGLAAELEKRFGPIEKLAAEYKPTDYKSTE